MKQHKKADGKPPKAGRRKKATAPKRPNAPKAARSNKSPAAREETEVARLRRERDEALERQTATADILKVIASSPTDVQPVFDVIVQTSRELCRSQASTIFILREGKFHVVAFSGVQTELLQRMKDHPISIDKKGSALAHAAREKRTIHIPNTREDPEFVEGGPISIGGPRATLTVPLMRDGEVIGGITLRQSYLTPYTPRQIEAIETFASQAVIAIENTRLFNDTQEALERQTATADILKVIASSPTDVQPVFDAIAESAKRLLGGFSTTVYRVIGDVIHLAALTPTSLEADAALKAEFPVRLNKAARSLVQVASGEAVQIADSETADPQTQRLGRARGWRSVMFTPLMNKSAPIGFITVTRVEPGAFAPHHIQLLQTFADQAVIAIENARLFNETQEALERQTATADILKVIASSPTDVQPVFDAIAERSNRLIGGHSTAVYRFIDQTALLTAFTPVSPEADAVLRSMFPRPLSMFRQFEMVSDGETVQIADVEAAIDVLEEVKELARARGWQSSLLVPLIVDRGPIGIISVTRKEPGGYAEHHVNLLKTFADQAVIAISNVNLFEQVQQRTRELSLSLDDLRTAQDRLVQTEKLASLGQLTAGIAHEIKNPLNFVNNFSALSAELVVEMNDVLAKTSLDMAAREALDELAQMLKSNLEKVVQHGKRADSIVKNMLQHSREGSGEHRLVDINAIVDESLNLAYHGARAEKPSFSIAFQRDFDPSVGMADIYPQEITRVLLNIISNGFYAATKQKAQAGDGFEPTLAALTKNLGDKVEIRIRDNGTGIPEEVKDKIFNPFFTTKPSGEGTGLGLSMSHDIIVKQHGGSIDVETKPGLFTEFKIVLPRTSQR